MAKDTKIEEKEAAATGSTAQETTTIPTKQLKGLIERLENLERGQKFEKPKRVTERIATLRFLEDKPVVKYTNVREVVEEGKRLAYMDIYVLGSDEPVKVKYLDFLNSDNSYKVSIESQKAEEIRENHGRAKAINPDQAKINSKTWATEEVELEVVSFVYTATVKVLAGPHEGKEFVVPTNCLNS